MSLSDINMDHVARSLESGFGARASMLQFVDPEFRLRMNGLGACGIASMAVAGYLRHEGIDAEAVAVAPGLSSDPLERHAFVLVNEQDTKSIVDPTYGQLFTYAGLNYYYAQLNNRGADIFPTEKIISFDVGRREDVARSLAQFAIGVQGTLSFDEEVFLSGHRPPALTTEEEVGNMLLAFWDYENATGFESPDEVAPLVRIMFEKIIN